MFKNVIIMKFAVTLNRIFKITYKQICTSQFCEKECATLDSSGKAITDS